MARRAWLVRSSGVALIALTMLATAAAPAAANRPPRGDWTPTGSMTFWGGRADFTMTLLPDGQVLAAGAYLLGADFMTGAAETFDPTTGSWTTAAPMSTSRADAIAALLPDGKVLVAGGAVSSAPWSATSRADLYDPASRLWSPTGAMVAPRIGLGAATLADGRVLVAGGWGDDLGGPTSSAELYDPITGMWTETGSMALPRGAPTLTLLPTGQVLAAGGSADATTELYDPGTGSWTTTGSLQQARRGHTATLLPTGDVLVVGGGDPGAPLSSVEIYDVTTGVWEPAESLSRPRTGHAAVLLDKPAQVLVISGGWSEVTAELFDVHPGRWRAAAPIVEGRGGPEAVLLQDGRVLVAGGAGLDELGGVVSLQSAELYERRASGRDQ